MPAEGRIRKGINGFQGVSMKDNWRTQWFKTEETAQRHLDDHIDSLKGSKKKVKVEPVPSEQPHAELVDQEASDVPPGGEDTGPRG